MIGKVIYSLLNSSGIDSVPLTHVKNYPVVTYSKISNNQGYTHQGNDGIGREIYQLSCWGESFSEAETLRASVKSALDAYTGTIEGVNLRAVFNMNESDLYEDETGIYQCIVDLEFIFEEE
jgi:hypothetical protein